MKKLWIGIMITAVMAAASQAALIVQLGARGGTRDMVTTFGNGQNSTPSTYDAQTLYNPLAPALGYTGDAFGGAATKNQNNNWVNDVTTNSRNGRITDAGFDYIQVLSNMGTNQATAFYEAMLVWDGGANGSGQSAFLTGDRDLESFHIEFKARGASTPTTVSFAWSTNMPAVILPPSPRVTSVTTSSTSRSTNSGSPKPCGLVWCHLGKSLQDTLFQIIHGEKQGLERDFGA